MSHTRVTFEIQKVAAYGPVDMTKALKTGGKTEPDKFVRMFESLVFICLRECDILGYGFQLRESEETIADISWVDNNFILAKNLEEGRFMTDVLTDLMFHRYGWVWKESSLEILEVDGDTDTRVEIVECSTARQTFKRTDAAYVLGCVLTVKKPSQGLIDDCLR